MNLRRLLEDGIDRDGGFLTPGDRRFLLEPKLVEGDEEPTDEEITKINNRRRQRRHRIRKRTRKVIRDLPYLLFADNDARQIMNDERFEDLSAEETAEIAHAATAAFVRVMTSVADRDRVMMVILDTVRLDAQLEFAHEHFAYADVTVNDVLNNDMPDPDECPSVFDLRRQLEAGEEISEDAESLLYHLGLIDTGERARTEGAE